MVSSPSGSDISMRLLSMSTLRSQASKRVYRCLHCRLCRNRIAHVERYGLHPILVLLDQRSQLLRPARTRHNAVTRGQSRLSNIAS